MSILTDKHGNTLRSANSERLDYLMNYEEFSQLVRAHSSASSKIEARINCIKVWKQLGNKYGFNYKSVHRPKDGNKNPRAFSAIPNTNDATVREPAREKPEETKDKEAGNNGGKASNKVRVSKKGSDTKSDS